MVITIPQLIAAINPDKYHDYGTSKKSLTEFKELIKEKGIQEAAKKAKPKALRLGKKDKLNVGTGIEAKYTLTYDSPTETLEPIYFFILDLMNEFGLAPEKMVDNFASSPGSQHFGDMGQRSSIMQQQGSKLLGDINTVLRSILNLIYDLREFKIRLQSYQDLTDSSKKDGAILSLKQIWMDKVDVQKGNSSIKAMALGQAGFNTLIDAFLVVGDTKDVDKLDLNNIVKQILKPRIHEFNVWLTNSEQELQKRYEIEKTYLKSQVNSLKIYSRWAKPYMKAAQELEMSETGRNPALVKMFNSLLLELTLLGKQPAESSYSDKYYSPKRKVFKCILADFNFRGIPNRTQQGFVVGGRAEITFRAYVLNEEEIKTLEEELKKSDMNSALSLIEGATDESLGHLQEDIDYFLKEDEEGKKEVKKSSDSSNPFLALIGGYNEKSPKKEKKKGSEGIKMSVKDKWVEKNFILPNAMSEAKESAFSIFEIYKKAHGMPSFPSYT